MLTLYNSLTRQKAAFTPTDPKRVGLYTCGPTLYDRQHIGNLRTFLLTDLLRRALVEEGYGVKNVMNVTDVEDKIIARLDGQNLAEFTQPFWDELKADMEAMKIDQPGWIRATEERSIKKMAELIGEIWEHGYAYDQDGSIYLSIQKYLADFPYGIFQKIDPSKLRATGRVDADEYDKDSPQDFALWKAKKEGEPSWTITVDGREFEGRPGWHIECSAMTELELGEEFDIHAAGIDLLFPHHENEVAQTRAATGKLLARYWVHGEMLAVEGEKMSKSLGNLFTLSDLREKGFDPLDLRYLFLQAHYRSKQNFTWEALRGAAAARQKLQQLYRDQSRGGDGVAARKFHDRIRDDLDTPGALAVVWEESRGRTDQKQFLEAVERSLAIGITTVLEIPEQVNGLVQRREEARVAKDFETSDKLRAKIGESGFWVEDTPEGPRISHKLD